MHIFPWMLLNSHPPSLTSTEDWVIYRPRKTGDFRDCSLRFWDTSLTTDSSTMRLWPYRRPAFLSRSPYGRLLEMEFDLNFS